MKVFVEYNFIFDPKDTWMNQNQFETDLGVFFKAKGFVAEVVESNNKVVRTIYIEKSDSEGIIEPPTKEKSIKQVKAQLSQKRGFDGKFEKRNV